MKKNRTIAAVCLKQVLISLLVCATGYSLRAQGVLVCTDLATVSLDESCGFTLTPPMVLEGGPYDSIALYYVEIDKTLPFGNGPWVPAVLETADINKMYQTRVTDPTTGNRCWANLKILTHMDCNGLTTVQLDANGLAALTPANLQITLADACIPGNTMTATKINDQASLSLNCSNLGISTVQVTATTQSGFAATCSAALLVTDPLETCDTCLVCPPPAFVSFSQATGTLLPALQSGNLAAFDIYGQAEYLSACTYSDSSYAVTYHPAAADQSWFIRQWTGLGAAGEVIGICAQPLVFTFDQQITVQGNVFIDSIINCVKDPAEYGFSVPKLQITRLPSQTTSLQTLNADGSYNFSFTTHGIDSVVVVALQLPNDFTNTCPNILVVPAASTTTQYSMDFGVPVDTLCHNLEVSIETPFLRRCSDNTYYIRYCNNSLQSAPNAFITIDFDPLLQVTGSGIPWSDSSNNVYTFPLGTVPPFACADFTVNVMLDCGAILGQTLCSSAVIHPNQICGNLPWTGPVIQTSAYCDGDSVKLAIWNTGAQNMTEALDFIVIEDIIMYRSGEFQLDAGDSITIAMEANGATWRIEAEQVPGNPLADAPASSIEACGGLNFSGLINAFAQNDAAGYVDRICSEVRGSFDPNDKSAVPTGYGPDHIIRENTDLEYKIRFQNTGNDTAFRVVIVDTLSEHLDFARLTAGASSHPYKLEVYPGGILHFVFDPIMLPDSNVNEAGSHGFVSFRIAQKRDLPLTTSIQNTAHIYFDFNDAVVTNTVRHTIGAPFITVAAYEAHQPGIHMEVQPNPMHDRSVVRITGHALKQGILTLYDQLGKAVQVQHFDGNTCILTNQGLADGLYIMQVTDGGRMVSSARVVVH